MNYQELVEELTKAAAQIAADITIKTIEEQRQADAKAIKDRRKYQITAAQISTVQRARRQRYI